MPLLIKTYLKEVEGKGQSLFAKEFIKQGTKIYEDNPLLDRILEKQEVEKLHSVIKEFIEANACYKFDTDTYYLNCDNARFINHSETPNINFNNGFIANRNIGKDEEIVCDYREIDDYSKNGDFGFCIK